MRRKSRQELCWVEAGYKGFYCSNCMLVLDMEEVKENLQKRYPRDWERELAYLILRHHRLVADLKTDKTMQVMLEIWEKKVQQNTYRCPEHK